MITFKQIIILLVIIEVYIYVLVTVFNAFTPDNPKPLTEAEINAIIKNCPSCAAPMYEAGMIEPKR
jgi:hypothetical protein